jgi:phosphatidylserine/phosphatidylglycerophosphate/cardiolipin synthase-like enzyme
MYPVKPRLLAWLLFWGLALTACQPTASAPPTAPLTAATTTPIEVFFTQPVQPTRLRGGLDDTVAASIDRARLTVDAALYDLDLWSIRDALLRAARRGVQVRIVAESDHLNRAEFQALQRAGIPIVGDGREALMHDKFIIIDRYEVWTGSMNYTLNGVYRNNNNEVRLRSSRVAADYEAEFEEMFARRLFGEHSPANTPDPHLMVNGRPLGIFFAPEDHALAQLMDAVGKARKSVYFLAFSFTEDDLARLLIAKARAGVDVRGVMEREQYHHNRGSEYLRLKRGGVSVFLDANPYDMHHKVFIIDGKTVEFGSYNFTYSAEKRNDENMVIVSDAGIAQKFTAEFWRLYQAAQKAAGR